MAIALSFISVQNDNQAESLDARRRFSAMTQAGTQAWPRYQIALLTSQDEDDWFITEIGTVTRTWAPVANGWHRLIYQRQEEIEPLTADDLLKQIPARLRGSVEDRLLTGGRLTAKGEAAVVAAFGSLRPQAAKTLRRLLGQQRLRRPRLIGEGLQAAGQEADAVTTALDIAGIPRAELRDTRPDGGSSFGAAIDRPNARGFRDHLRQHAIPRLRAARSPVGHRRVLTQQRAPDGHQREPSAAERTTGADLIYINERTQSFVLVQYKSFRREGERPARLVYRPDEQFNAELERMRAIKSGTKGSTHDAFRFHPGCCYLKFCKPISSLDHPPQARSGKPSKQRAFSLASKGS
jgi:hypothetical protein